MKKKLLTFWVLPILVVLFTACNTAKGEKSGGSVTNETTQAEQDRKNAQYASEVASYRVSVESDLRTNQLRIAQLRDEKTDLQNEQLVIRNERIAAAQKRNDELELRMRQYRGDNIENWNTFRSEFITDMNELRNSLDGIGKDSIK